MLSRPIRYCLILITGLFLAACEPHHNGKQLPKVINGEIDLTGWNFEKDGSVKLQGDWLFAWEKFVEPNGWEELRKEMVHTLPVPGYWHNFQNPADPNHNLPGTGYASYAVRIIGLSENEELSLAIEAPHVALKLYRINDQGVPLEIKDIGKIANRKGIELPKFYTNIKLNLESVGLEKSRKAIFLLQISNHHYFKGGLWSSMWLGKDQKIQTRINRSGQLQDFMAGIFFILGLYHLLLYLQRRKDKAALFFSLVSLSLALRLFSMGVAQRAGFVDSVFAWELLAKFDYISLPLISMSFGLYLYSLLPGKLSKLVSRYNNIIGTPLIVFPVFTSALVFPAYLWLYQVYVVTVLILICVTLALYSFQGKKIATQLLLSFTLIGVGIINDILHTYGLIETMFLGPYATILFLLIQAGFISYRNSKAYETAEHLSEKLSEAVHVQTARLRRIQDLTREIQNSSSLEEFYNALKMTLRFLYKIKNFSLLMVNDDSQCLELFDLSTSKMVYDQELLKKKKIDLTHPHSLHGKVLQKKKSYVIKKAKTNNKLENNEQAFIQIFNMTALYLLPLEVADHVFAIFSIFDTKDDELSYIANLTKEGREELEELSSLISAGLLQHMQKEDLQKAQAAASRAKNEAAINQLAAHLAHEVNNPLNYIATGKIMQSDSFEKYHEMIRGVLTGDDEGSLAFKQELDSLQAKFKLGLEQTDEGQARITKVVAEIRAITGVDGLNFSNFDLVPIINEELIYSLQRNQVKSGEQSVRVTGTNEPLMVLSNPHILARSIRTIISNCTHFARSHRGNKGEMNIDCQIRNKVLRMEFGNNSFSIKNKNLDDLFDLEKSESYGTEQIGLAMIKELLHKINCSLVLADHGRESGKVIFQLQVPLEG